MHAQIQTYASCTQQTFVETLQRFRLALEQLDCTDPAVLSWVTGITWPENDEDSFGDVYAAPVTLTPHGATSLKTAGIEISLYTTLAVHSLKDLPAWVGFNLLLDTEDLRTENTEPYTSAEGQSIWRILLVLAHHFTEVGAYFTEDWQDNQAWRAIIEGSADPWIFELGIFPRSLAAHFQEIPAGFKGTVTPDGFGFAQSNRWQQLPWENPA
jgi:hypothetical protein